MDYNFTTMDNNHPTIVCRACLKEGQHQHMFYIYTLDVIVRQWLQDATLQNPASEDSYPKYICDACYGKLDSFQQFHQMCKRSREMYRDMMKKLPMSETQLNVVSNRLATSEMIDDDVIQQDCNDVNEDDVVDKDANNDWLEFDFVPAPTIIGSAYATVQTCKQKSRTGADGVLPTTSRTCSSNDNINKNSKRTYEEISTPHNAPPGQHVCEECGEIFEKVVLLKQHQFIHRPDHEHPYFCNQCNKIFKNRRTFTEHQMRHAGIKNFECPYCGIKKTTKYELQAHINYHTKERQWLCPHCPLVFNSTRNLRTHDQVVHQGLRRYKCQYCEKAFGKPDALKQHIMTHTGEKPHECLECGKRFAQLVSLKTHVLKTHTPVC